VGYKKCPHNWAHRKAEQHDFDRRSKDQQKVRAQEPQRRNTTSHKRREQHDKNGKARTDREKVDKQRPAGLRELPKEQPAVLKKALAYCREEFRACEVRGRARPVVLKVAGMTPDKLVAELVRVRKVRAELRQACTYSSRVIDEKTPGSTRKSHKEQRSSSKLVHPAPPPPCLKRVRVQGLLGPGTKNEHKTPGKQYK
jgi:hypothetical protein